VTLLDKNSAKELD